ncbi:trypsin-7-like [Babylonia areolata]|uniref:trypsin-7-like n=1 Tax=Babylonia areolata TaxID=304850 RepID=UPI003FD2A39B
MASTMSMMPAVRLLVVLCSALPLMSGVADASSSCLQMCQQNRRWLCSVLCRQADCLSPCRFVNDITDYNARCLRSCLVTTPAPPPRSCGVSSTGRIVGGTRVSDCELPWTVVVNVGTRYCGGTILNHNTVLTAGHCVYSTRTGKAQPNTVSVKYGSSDQWSAKTAFVTRVDIHPRFVLQYFDYDVALLTLDRTLPFNKCVQPICLPQVDLSPYQTQGCQAAGWGAVDFSRPAAQRFLRKVELPIVSLADCLKAYGSRLVSDIKICAGFFQNGGKDSCLGDSGGPLMCYKDGAFYQFGVVSFGRACARPRSPGVYSRVTHSLINSWIRNMTSTFP